MTNLATARALLEELERAESRAYNFDWRLRDFAKLDYVNKIVSPTSGIDAALLFGKRILPSAAAWSIVENKRFATNAWGICEATWMIGESTYTATHEHAAMALCAAALRAWIAEKERE